jgi:pSer/pThr/pTyr-binding forkhead associated (FHA) protein
VDQSERYLQLALLGRSAFLASAAPAALVRRRFEDAEHDTDSGRGADDDVETLVAPVLGQRRGPRAIEVYPLSKKPGASFADMITIGRTANNDVVLRDVTVSRFHAYFRHRVEQGVDRWLVADAGSRNGSELGGAALEARREREVTSGAPVRIGDLELTFFVASELFEVLRDGGPRGGGTGNFGPSGAKGGNPGTGNVGPKGGASGPAGTGNHGPSGSRRG